METWREAGEEYISGQVRDGGQALPTAGQLAPELVDPFSHILLAALNEASPQRRSGANDIATFELAAAAVSELLTRLLGTPALDPRSHPGRSLASRRERLGHSEQLNA